MFASKNMSRNPIQLYSNFSQKLEFLGRFHAIQDSVFRAKYIKSGKRPRKRFSISFQKKKRTWMKFLSRHCFPAVMNNQSPNSGFLEISLSHFEHYSSAKNRCAKIVLNTAATSKLLCYFDLWNI